MQAKFANGLSNEMAATSMFAKQDELSGKAKVEWRVTYTWSKCCKNDKDKKYDKVSTASTLLW